MGFRINTNVAALSAHSSSVSNNRYLDSSLGKLNSGLRITSAADDASGMAIADSLRGQARSLGRAIMNANDAIGVIQTADKAMDEQIKILDTIKEKAIQAAQDTQTTETRKALQADISRLMEELDNIGNTTSFNGQKLLSGTFSNKEFQIGAYSNETVKASIGPTTSDKIGLTRFETGRNVRLKDLSVGGGAATLTFKNVDGINDITFEQVKLVDGGNIKAGMGLGALAEAINKGSDKTGIKASAYVESIFEQPIKAGTTREGFSINGVVIGSIEVKEKDGNGALRAAINSVSDQTGVEASVDNRGRLVLNNRDGRGIRVTDGVDKSAPKDATAWGKVNGDKTLGPARNKIAEKGDADAGTEIKALNDAADKLKDDMIKAFGPDKHVFWTDDAAGHNTANGQEVVDFADPTIWHGGEIPGKDGSGAAGSILSKHNSFNDVRNAYYEQDARHAWDGYTKGAAVEVKDGKVDLSKITAASIGAMNLNANLGVKPAKDGTATDITNASEALAAIKAADLSVPEANQRIDTAIKALSKVEQAAVGTTMDKGAAEDGMVAHAFISFLKGLKEGLNEKDRAGLADIIGLTDETKTNFGRLSLVSTAGKDIVVDVNMQLADADGNLTKSVNVTDTIGYDDKDRVSEKTVSLRETNATIGRDLADAMGFNSNEWQFSDRGDNLNGYPAGVMTLKGAMAMMNIAESASKALERIRSDLGSVQNQLASTIENISVTQVNVKSAESNIRDVDFAEESATFSKHQILAQSGVYAMSQANAVQQNVMKLLQ